MNKNNNQQTKNTEKKRSAMNKIISLFITLIAVCAVLVAGFFLFAKFIHPDSVLEFLLMNAKVTILRPIRINLIRFQIMK